MTYLTMAVFFGWLRVLTNKKKLRKAALFLQSMYRARKVRVEVKLANAVVAADELFVLTRRLLRRWHRMRVANERFRRRAEDRLGGMQRFWARRLFRALAARVESRTRLYDAEAECNRRMAIRGLRVWSAFSQTRAARWDKAEGGLPRTQRRQLTVAVAALQANVVRRRRHAEAADAARQRSCGRAMRVWVAKHRHHQERLQSHMFADMMHERYQLR